MLIWLIMQIFLKTGTNVCRWTKQWVQLTLRLPVGIQDLCLLHYNGRYLIRGIDQDYLYLRTEGGKYNLRVKVESISTAENLGRPKLTDLCVGDSFRLGYHESDMLRDWLGLVTYYRLVIDQYQPVATA